MLFESEALSPHLIGNLLILGTYAYIYRDFHYYTPVMKGNSPLIG